MRTTELERDLTRRKGKAPRMQKSSESRAVLGQNSRAQDPMARDRPPRDLKTISRNLSREVSKLEFSAPVSHVYNPLEYARAPHEAYLEAHGRGQKQVLLFGMNPGPFGMAQTG